MKFRRIKIENFGAIGEAEVELADRGLILIQGENLDDTSTNSNGAGKSTIVEALSWCLYGSTAKGISGDAVVNRKVGKNCMVEVTIEDNGTIYGIKRHRKHKTGKNGLEAWSHEEEGDIGRTLTKGIDKLTQDVVNQIVGCSEDVFVAAVYAGQEAMPDLPAMTDRQLKLLIEEAAGITLLEQAHNLARLELSAAKGALADLESEHDRAKLMITGAKDRIEDAQLAIRKWKAERDARVIDLEVEAKRMVADAKLHKADMDSLRPEADIRADLEKLKETFDGLANEKAEHRRLEAEAVRLEKIAAAKESTARARIEAIKKASAELEDLKNHVGKPCTSCLRPHTEETLKSAIEVKKRQIGVEKDEARECVEAHKAASESARNARTALGDFERSMTDTTHAVAVSDALNEQLQATTHKQREYDSCIERANHLLAKIKAEKAALCPHEADLKARQLELQKCEEKVKDIEARIMPAREALYVAQSVVEVFSPRGVRSHILDTVTPYLNERTAHYLGSLADGRIEAIWQTITMTAAGEPRDKFSIQVTHADGADSFAALSGGEKRKVRIACALALQDLVATRATKPIDLWIGDEIDAALDTSGLERLMNVLEEKARERGTVLTISHSDLKEWFRDTITVVKEDGISRVAA